LGRLRRRRACSEPQKEFMVELDSQAQVNRCGRIQCGVDTSTKLMGTRNFSGRPLHGLEFSKYLALVVDSSVTSSSYLYKVFDGG